MVRGMTQDKGTMIPERIHRRLTFCSNMYLQASEGRVDPFTMSGQEGLGVAGSEVG